MKNDVYFKYTSFFMPVENVAPFSKRQNGYLARTRLKCIERLTEKIDTHSNTGKLIFHVFAALAEFERNLIRERTFAGLAAAKARGRVGGRRPKFEPKQIKKILKEIQANKHSITTIALNHQVSRTTIYSIINKNKKHNVGNGAD